MSNPFMATLFSCFVPRSLVFTVVLGALALLAGCGRSGEPFPVHAFLAAPDNLQGNRYRLDAEIDAQLNWREGVGRIIAVRPLKDDARLPVFIADSLKANLLVAQRYRFIITVRKGGLLYVEQLEKL